jgi:HAD superfamily hydrolase (TIGR01549 family)
MRSTCSGSRPARPPSTRRWRCRLPDRPRALLLDFGGTLDADGLTWKERFFRLWHAEGAAGSRETFDPVFYAADDALVGAVPRTLSFEDTVRRLTASLAAALGVRDAGATERVAARFLADAHHHLRRNQALLERLRPRYRLGIVSNFYGNLDTVCHNVAILPLLGVIVDSEQVGCSKPDPRIFLTALARLGVTPADAIFVGDSAARDMAGARALGMRHIWLTGEPAPPGGPCCPGDAMIHSLADVEALLS